MSNYNWRNTLGDLASICGVLAGFSITLIGVVLGLSIAQTNIIQGVTYGKVSILFFGIATVLFITTAELLLRAKEFDIFSCSDHYIRWLLNRHKDLTEDEIIEQANNDLKSSYDLAERFYSIAIFAIYFGLLFLIVPYNIFIATAIFLLGVFLEIWQMIKDRQF